MKGQGRPVLRKEESTQLSLAKKRPAHKRAKKDLQGLYELLAPGSIVVKGDNDTCSKKKPGKPQVTVLKTDVAKFGTRGEKDTPLV